LIQARASGPLLHGRVVGDLDSVKIHEQETTLIMTSQDAQSMMYMCRKSA
jgi:hypothetical protein